MALDEEEETWEEEAWEEEAWEEEAWEEEAWEEEAWVEEAWVEEAWVVVGDSPLLNTRRLSRSGVGRTPTCLVVVAAEEEAWEEEEAWAEEA